MNKTTKSVMAAATLAATLPSALFAQSSTPFALHDGDRVVFYGDSITDQKRYTVLAETYVVTRFPRLKVQFTDAGWIGDRVGGGSGGVIDIRLKRDVIAYNPTVMTIMLGMNDGGYRAFDQNLYDTYSKGYAHILDTVKAAEPNVRFTLIQPSPYDDVTQPPKFAGGYNAVLLKYSDSIAALAQQRSATLANFNAPVVAALQKAFAVDPTDAQQIIPDRVHPSIAGHMIMAESLLKAWNAPAVVTAVTIDAAGKTAARSVNATVGGIAATPTTLTWNQMDNALPMPYDQKDPVVALVLKSSDFIDALDQEPLQVTGLSGAKYDLKIDETDLGPFTREQLGAGINLATLPTPMFAQAQAVFQLANTHQQIHSNVYHFAQAPFQTSKNPAVQQAVASLVTALLDDEAKAAAQEVQAAQPVSRRYTLTALGP